VWDAIEELARRSAQRDALAECGQRAEALEAEVERLADRVRELEGDD
jgi:hypothetical protein